jgi:hypothetical protein
MTSALRKAISTFTSRGTFHDEEKLQAVIKAAKDEKRLSIYATMTRCPSCSSLVTTSAPTTSGTTFEMRSTRSSNKDRKRDHDRSEEK